jgi:predicted Zn-dependent protease
MTLTSVAGCPARVRLARSSQNNAFAARGYVILTTAALDFTANDDELAVIIGHELAHVALRHTERLDAQRVPRGLLRGFGKNAERVRATEEEADRLGLRLAWAAGYDPAAAVPFWRRYYAKFESPQLFRTHPGLRARERLIADTIALLEPGAKRPEFREGALPQR